MKTLKIAAAILVAASLSACAGPSVFDKDYRSQMAWREFTCNAEGGKFLGARCIDKPLWIVHYPDGGNDLWPSVGR